MLAYVVLLLAACTRLIPHTLHGIGLNFTATGGGLLFFGARRPRRQAAAAMLVMALTDVYLTCFAFDATFHLRDYLLTWAWYGGVCLLAGGILRQVTAVRVAVAVLCSTTGFFVLSNFAVWLSSGIYPHTVPGIAACYEAAIAFYANDLVSTGLTAGVLFGLPVAASRLVIAWRQNAERGQPIL